MAVVGGGPGGLFFATLLKRGLPSVEVSVFERNQRTDAFGFGVVFSDATLRAIDDADPVLRDALRDHGRHWDRIDVWSSGERHSFSGNGMAAIHRRTLLKLLQENAEQVGVHLRFGSVAPPLDELRRQFDLVVGADGTHSAVRRELDRQAPLGHELETASAKFIWFGATYLFEGLTFLHRVAEHGNFAVHGYPISDELSTFIVETDEETWRRAGMDRFDFSQPPGPSDTVSQDYLQTLFADDIPGGRLVANNSRWANFHTRRPRDWWRDNVVLLGDAVHTAHFSVGSGTKMAMEDAVVLAEQLIDAAEERHGLDEALRAYQRIRQVSVRKIQGAARPSLAWWEHFGTYQRTLDPRTFSFHFFSRSIGVDRIAQRDPDLVADVRCAWARRHSTPPLTSTLTLPEGVTLGRRLQLATSGESAVLRDGEDRVAKAPIVSAPPHESDLERTAAALPHSGTVVITGDSGLPRTLLAERARLRHGLTTVVAGADLADDATAETMLLAGRADAVAVPTDTAVSTTEGVR